MDILTRALHENEVLIKVPDNGNQWSFANCKESGGQNHHHCDQRKRILNIFVIVTIAVLITNLNVIFILSNVSLLR